MLILVRHGESVANAQGLLLGRTDAELTEAGRAQAAAVPMLFERPVVELRSSPLRRAVDTAELLGLGLPVVVDPRWIEVDYGEFECQPLGDIPADVWQKWQRDRDFCPADGESLAEVDLRIADACEELFASDGGGARRADGDVVIVSDPERERVPLGVVTDRDLVVRGLAEGEGPDSPVGPLCSGDLVGVAADADVVQAEQLMREHAVRRLPVVSDGQVVGIVSIGDLAVSADADSPLAAVSRAQPTT